MSNNYVFPEDGRLAIADPALGSRLNDLNRVTAAAIASATVTQAGATPITTAFTEVVTVASAGNALVLPPAVPGAPPIVVFDAHATNGIVVFPASAAQGGVTGGDKINNLAVNISLAIAATKAMEFVPTALGQWRSFAAA